MYYKYTICTIHTLYTYIIYNIYLLYVYYIHVYKIYAILYIQQYIVEEVKNYSMTLLKNIHVVSYSFTTNFI